MSSENSHFLQFSRPFLTALYETFETMVHTKVKGHSPRIKNNSKAFGEVTAMIGMNGTVEKEGQINVFKGILALSWPESVYLKVASKMLMEEYTEYNDEIADAGSEIANIVMGNAKNGLSHLGLKIEMASPTTVKGNKHEIKYPPKSTVVEITISSELGDFSMELCYQEY